MGAILTLPVTILYTIYKWFKEKIIDGVIINTNKQERHRPPGFSRGVLRRKAIS